MDKPEIIFTLPFALGGVSSFNFNIINNSKLLKKFYSKVILIKNANETRPSFTEKFNVDEQIVFVMSDFENIHPRTFVRIFHQNNYLEIPSKNFL